MIEINRTVLNITSEAFETYIAGGYKAGLTGEAPAVLAERLKNGWNN